MAAPVNALAPEQPGVLNQLYKTLVPTNARVLIDTMRGQTAPITAKDFAPEELDVLRQIEDGKVDQHEGSVLVGKILKELYVDSALKRCNAINETIDTPETTYADAKTISWKQYKQMNGN